MSNAQEFIDKVRTRRSNELEQGIETREMRMWMALADVIEELADHGHSYAACYGPGGEWDTTTGPVTAKVVQ